MSATAKSILLTSLGVLLLYFSGFLVFATPAPLIYFALRYRKEDVYKLIAGLGVIMVLIQFVGVPLQERLWTDSGRVISIAPTSMIEILGPVRAGLFGAGHFALYLALGILIARLLLKHVQEASRYVFYFTTGLFVVTGVLVLVLIGPHLTELIDVYRAQTLAGFKEFIVAQERAGLGFERLVMLQSILPDIVKHSVYLMPFGFWLFVVVMFLLNLLLFRNYFQRSPATNPQDSLKLGSFRIPFFCVWCVIALIAALMFNLKHGHSSFVLYFSLNFLAALIFAYFLQGMTIVTCFIERKNIFGPFRVFAYLLFLFLILSVPFVLPILIILGFAENWIDFRSKIKVSKG